MPVAWYDHSVYGMDMGKESRNLLSDQISAGTCMQLSVLQMYRIRTADDSHRWPETLQDKHFALPGSLLNNPGAQSLQVEAPARALWPGGQRLHFRESYEGGEDLSGSTEMQFL